MVGSEPRLALLTSVGIGQHPEAGSGSLLPWGWQETQARKQRGPQRPHSFNKSSRGGWYKSFQQSNADLHQQQAKNGLAFWALFSTSFSSPAVQDDLLKTWGCFIRVSQIRALVQGV